MKLTVYINKKEQLRNFLFPILKKRIQKVNFSRSKFETKFENKNLSKKNKTNKNSNKKKKKNSKK